jgi:hypothetical protein
MSANALFGAAHARIAAVELGLGRGDSALAVRSDVRVGYADDRQSDSVPRRVTARATKVSLGLDYRPFYRFSPFAFGSAEANLQQRIARRYDAGLGAKVTFLRREREDLSVSLALLWERTAPLRVSGQVLGPSVTRARWSLRFRTRRQLTPTLFVSHVTFYQPAVAAVGRYTTDMTTTLENRILSALSLTASLRDRYDSEATRRGAASNHDGQLLVGVRAGF